MDRKAAGREAAEGIHAGNAGGIWQCVVFGFLGLVPAYLTETLSFSPRFPPHWKSVRLCLEWHGQPMTIVAYPDRVEIDEQEPSPGQISPLS
jgi:hypothetical glycosyl hydrolase